MSRLALLLAASLATAVVVPVHAQTPTALTGGKRAKWKDAPVAERDSASVSFATDPALFTLADPRCASSASGAFVRFSTSTQVNPAVNVPCTGWTISGSGFRYKDLTAAAGGVLRIVYTFGKLTIKVKGPNYTPPIVGPVSFADVRFDVGSLHYCGRFTTFTRNEATLVAAVGPSSACTVTCGDGIREGSELCDDGNGTNGDGCDTNCTPTACGNGV